MQFNAHNFERQFSLFGKDEAKELFSPVWIAVNFANKKKTPSASHIRNENAFVYNGCLVHFSISFSL